MITAQIYLVVLCFQPGYCHLAAPFRYIYTEERQHGAHVAVGVSINEMMLAFLLNFGLTLFSTRGGASHLVYSVLVGVAFMVVLWIHIHSNLMQTY